MSDVVSYLRRHGMYIVSASHPHYRVRFTGDDGADHELNIQCADTGEASKELNRLAQEYGF